MIKLLYTILQTSFILFFITTGCGQKTKVVKEPSDLSTYVNPYIGTAAQGNAVPVASVPHGMVQIGPDTRMTSSGFHYSDSSIIGFSHLHKTGGGCGDLLDILFQPVSDSVSILAGSAEDPDSGYRSRFDKTNEQPEPGKYQVYLADYDIKVELSATERAAIHRYTYPESDFKGLIIDLKHGNQGACTIVKEEGSDTVRVSGMKIINEQTIEGYRVSDGWAKGQHVFFTARFSQPFQVSYLFDRGELTSEKSLESNDIKAILKFDECNNEPLIIKVGVSAIDNQGSANNLDMEIPHWDLDQVALEAKTKWNEEFGKFKTEGGQKEDLQKFYTCIFHWAAYPMIYSDVDGRYRGPNEEILKADGYIYYGGVVGLWDTFRGANPLLVNTKPKIANDYIKTFLAHYERSGLLPVWVLQSHETLTMIGYHSMPVIADTYFKGVRDYDIEAVYDAMVASAKKDTFGVSMQRVMGTKNYKKYGYIPADLEYESVAQTLEFAYDDWCIAQMAKMLDKHEEYEYFMNRSKNYQNVFDTTINFVRGRMSDGMWRTPFNPFYSNHRKDDYCEGTAWQWTFFVPHDINGLAELMGGKKQLAAKLDSLITVQPRIQSENASRSSDISGMIGQYAHGNEPSHHIIYMYNEVGQPWKAQKLIHLIMNELYLNTPEGYSGNEDTGQMAAWYIWNAMGMYPVTHGDGKYQIGAPFFEKMAYKHANGILTVLADKPSSKHIYVDEIKVNGENYRQIYFDHYDIFKGDVTIDFKMSDKPNKKWFSFD